MFETYEVEENYFEAHDWQEECFDQAPHLDPWDARFINDALRSGNTADLCTIMGQAEAYKAFWSSIEARAAARIDASTGAQPTRHTSTQERGTAHFISLARRQSPRGSITYLRRIRHLVPNMPYTFSQFERGVLNEKTVLAILAPLDDLTEEHHKSFDNFYSDNPDLFNGAGIKEAKNIAQQAADKLLGTERLKDIKDTTAARYVRMRKGKDCMFLNAKVPIDTGTAFKDFLDTEVASAKAKGDERTPAQIRADILLRAATGNPLDQPLPVRLHLGLIMTDQNLFMQHRENVTLTGYGSLPDDYAQRLMLACQIEGENPSDEFQAAIDQQIKALPYLRRLYLAPNQQDLVCMDSRERLFTGQLRHLIQLRDPYCRTPYCDNNVKHADHIKQAAKGGETSFDNSGMKCGACNLAKEAKGWEEEVVISGAPHRIVIRPTSDTEFISSPPPIRGVVRTIRSWFQRRDLIPPVPVKYPNPPKDENDRIRRRTVKRPSPYPPPMPPYLPPELDPNSDF
ncbi:hypothetical protein AUR04nite_07090 [Glutamicibacter uratoxydans]|uniref:HNH domain-containing protein n=1 Tax=Glutamicibacter uratoxydans TaxID=43667 RepID=A0A4Y4DKM6_GLUUR|nr:HNH endonuclease [Glutamicibacter uratoxydans]GED05177.1 hypothetical protein AUR04nite_07090 [Glutamicibacter uratoxydans]